jgi:hypothetical protein
MNKELLYSYLRTFGATVLGAIFAIGKLPIDFTVSDWRSAANAVWIAMIPVAIRYLNPNDATFGRKTDSSK